MGPHSPKMSQHSPKMGQHSSQTGRRRHHHHHHHNNNTNNNNTNRRPYAHPAICRVSVSMRPFVIYNICVILYPQFFFTIYL